MKCGSCGLTGHNKRSCTVIPQEVNIKRNQRKCRCCGIKGHNGTTCPTKPLDWKFGGDRPTPVPRRTERKCGICGIVGHTRNTCTVTPTVKEVNHNPRSKCGICGIAGHNKKTCPQLYSDEIQDEEPMDEDYVLSDEEDEVDLATTGYSGITLCDDLLELVGFQVKVVREKATVDYWADLTVKSKTRFGITSGLINRKDAGIFETCINRDRIIDCIDTLVRRRKIEFDLGMIGYIPDNSLINSSEFGDVAYVVNELKRCSDKPYKVKVIKRKKQKGKKVTCICGKCGRRGHTASNRSFH